MWWWEFKRKKKCEHQHTLKDTGISKPQARMNLITRQSVSSISLNIFLTSKTVTSSKTVFFRDGCSKISGSDRGGWDRGEKLVFWKIKEKKGKITNRFF